MSDQTPPIALTALKIRNFRGIESLDLDFRGPDGLPNRLVVIGGPNGSGKTAVLEAAIMVVQDHHGKIDPRNIRRGADHLRIEGVIHDSGAEPTERVRRASTFSLPDESSASFVPFWYLPTWRTPGIGGPVHLTDAASKDACSNTAPNRLQAIKQKLVDAAAVEKSGGESQQYSRWIKAINQAWNQFDPTQKDSIQVGWSESGDSRVGSFDLFHCPIDQPRLEVDYLSTGQLELLMLIAEGVFEPERVGIVFIDEPELYLDPQWHQLLLRTLVRLQPRTQFIVTTHSPEMLDSTYSYERHCLVPDTDSRARLWARTPAKLVEM